MPDPLLAPVRAAIARRAARGWDATDAATRIAAAWPAEADPLESDRLEVLALRCGLAAAEVDLLRVAAAAERTTAGHLLSGLLSGDDGPGRPTVALGLELAGLDPVGPQARRLLSESSPLRRFGLLELSGDDVLLARRLVLPTRVAEHLAGVDTPPTWVLGLLVEPVPVPGLDTDALTAAVTGDQPFVWIHAPAGHAGTELAATACARLGAPVWVLDLGRLPVDRSAEQAVPALLLECALAGVVAVLLDADRVPAGPLRSGVVPVLAVSALPWDPAWSDELPAIVAAPRWTSADRLRVWRDLGLAEVVSQEVVAMRLSADQIVRAARHARTMAGIDGEPDLTADRLRASVRRLGRTRAVRAGAGARLDDLVLPPHSMDEIRRLLDWARHRDDVLADQARGAGLCVLFSGPPGTGKTLAAHVVADSLGMDLFQVDLSSTVDKYIGETEKNLERLFAQAEAEHAVLFFDEADALFGSRSEVRDARDRYANQEIAYLLQRMETFDGITVLASNLRGNLDPAFARRLHFIVTFPDPDIPTRARLWEHHLRGVRTDPDDAIPVENLAREVDLAGGDIRNIVLSARFAAVADGVPLGGRHVEAAVRREYIKLGRRQSRRA